MVSVSAKKKYIYNIITISLTQTQKTHKKHKNKQKNRKKQFDSSSMLLIGTETVVFRLSSPLEHLFC